MDLFVLLLVALLGGAVSVLTPCILPLLPSILAFSTGEGRRRVWGIVAGIEFSFIGISLLLSGLLRTLGLPSRTLELVAAVALVLFGLTLAIPRLDELFQRVVSRGVSRLPQARTDGDGFRGGFLAGSTLGLVWAPCAGPILAAITVAANADGFTAKTVLVTLAYGAGMVLPLAGVIFGGRRLGTWLNRRLGGGRRVLLPMGLLLIATGLLIGFGQFTKVTRTLAEKIELTSTPLEPLERKALERERSADNGSDGDDADAGGRPSQAALDEDGYPASEDGELHDLGEAPDFAKVNRWYNTADGKPLTMGDLRGKVVLIDFWTYSCINCLRTLPYIRAWHRKYEDDGLVIVGVHTPEFEFEKDEGNVKRAIADLDLAYPIATDPDYGTWKNFYNHYWPAKYLIDRDGQLRFVHYGEGEYGLTEQHIRTLLDVRAGADDAAGDEVDADAVRRYDGHARTPETYLGYSRIDTTQYSAIPEGNSAPDIVPDTDAVYQAPKPTAPGAGLLDDQFAFVGRWNVQDERATAGADDAQLLLHYQGSDVFLVIGPPADGSNGKVEVLDSQGTSRTLTIDGHRLYTLRKGDSWANGLLKITASSGVSVYAFTFG